MGNSTQKLHYVHHDKAVFVSAQLTNQHRWMWERMALANVAREAAAMRSAA
jgi:hypothetical protein